MPLSRLAENVLDFDIGLDRLRGVEQLLAVIDRRRMPGPASQLRALEAREEARRSARALNPLANQR